MDLYPAIDVRGGRCVRLHQGDYGRETVYADDPVAVATSFADAGAPWVHVVDLDAARSGRPENFAVVAAIAAALRGRASLQTGGGVRDEASAEALIAAGATRVVMGTAAVEDPAMVRRLASRLPVAVGLDGRGGRLAVRGWKEASDLDVLEAVELFANAGVAAFVVTEIARDGTLEGPDLGGLAQVLAHTEVDVIASGGVGTLEDLKALAALDVAGRRLAGAIVGKALYAGTVTLADALALGAG